MSVGYTGVQWNRQKRIYDAVLLALILVVLGVYAGVSLVLQPSITAETLLIRGMALAAFALLHVVLCIGPLARLDRRFLPFLFNRRHLGVAVFLLAAGHAGFSVIQFHALGNVNPLVSVFTSYKRDYAVFSPGSTLAHFPFEPFGVLALVILFLMAATSHDFWLRNLGPSMWKTLHVLVLAAYGSLVLHVAYGVLQTERSPLWVAALGLGAATVLGLHVAAAGREARGDRRGGAAAERDGFVRACAASELVEGRGKTVLVEGERVALYLAAGRVYGISNVCRHQGGPLGEGRIIDGCVTCPWHGWQYRPSDGCSPPPFEEKIETHRVRVVDGEVWIDPRAAPPGTAQEGAAI